MSNERRERLRVEIPSQPPHYVTPDEEDTAPPPLPARKNHAHLSGHLQSPTSPVLFPRSPRTSPRPSPRSSPMVSPNLSPENSPHPSPRLPRHRHEPIDILPDNDDIPPKLPARTKKARSEDHLNSHFDAAAHPMDPEEARGRFPYAGIDHACNKRTVPIENSAKTTYADLAFPKQVKDIEVSRRHPPIGPRLSLNDKEISDFNTTEPNHTAFDDVDNNFANNDFCVHDDPFEGANPFVEDKSQQQKGNSLPRDQFLHPRTPRSNLTQTSKSLENLTVDSTSEYSENENDYTVPTGGNSAILPRCFSNPTYVSNFDFVNSTKPGLSSTFPPRHNPPGSDGEQSMEFNEEDFQILMGQGYTREEIKKALIIAENNFAMARKILRSYHGTRPHQEE